MMVKIAGELALVGAIASVFIVAAQGWAQERAAEEASGRDYMRMLDEITSKMKNRLTLANWNYEVNITRHNEDQLMQISLEIAEEEKEYWKETMTYIWHEFDDVDLKRIFQKYAILGTSALPEDLNQRLLQAVSGMKSAYARASICDYHDRNKCDLHADDVEEIFAANNDPEELKYVFLEWHRVAGSVSKANFTEYVQMSNEVARLNGYDTAAEWWLSKYESKSIEKDFLTLWKQLRPLYQHLHAYVRGRLRAKYGEDIVSAKGPIPSHLLGNIWAHTWDNIEKDTLPFPNKTGVDITAALIEQNYTSLKLFQSANDFFASLGMMEVPELFWENSIIEKPNDGRDMVCIPTAWDFFDGEDFRIRQCTRISKAFFKTTHHQMGHIQYYLQYRDQPVIYREGANPGFHEAVGDLIDLSVSTLKHLRTKGLLNEDHDDTESHINDLYRTALVKIPLLSFAYLLDIYRYSVFRGTSTPDNYNCHFWQLKDSIQGVEPPAPRSEADFDPAAKYHVSGNIEYMRYYVSNIVQFQFYQTLCQLAGEYSPGKADKPLSKCDIYNSTAAGSALSKMLQMGSSKPWPDAMEVLTGQRYMDTRGLMEYFQPLYDWLVAENKRTGEYIGWEASNVEYCSLSQLQDAQDSEFQQLIKSYREL